MNWLEFACRHRYASGFELDVAFQASEHVVALFGPSGSGKTSVLSVIAGGLRPQQGIVVLGNRKLLDTSAGIALAPQRRHVGMVYQDHLLFPHLTVERNLRYGMRRRQGNHQAVDFRRAVDVLELGDLLNRYPRTLSGGERQRAAVARALLSGPEALLLDEPLAALDQSLKERILVYLERVLAEWRLPTLVVSHAAADVRRLAGWAVLLDQGRVVASGPPRDVLVDAP